MIYDFQIESGSNLKEALTKLNKVREISKLLLFVVNNKARILGSLTDGDIRRALIQGHTLETKVDKIMNQDFAFVRELDVHLLQRLRDLNLKIIPLLDEKGRIKDIIDFNKVKNKLPIGAIIMAGGRGKRLSPLTDNVPKPMLPVNNKPMIGHVTDHIFNFGIDEIFITVNYLKEQIEDYYKGNSLVQIVHEDIPLGTAGSISLIDKLNQESYLITNADILSNISLEDLYLEHINNKADITIASRMFQVDIPLGVINEENKVVISLKEKPTYDYYTNAGIYLVNKEILDLIPKNEFFNMTDLITLALSKGKVIMTYKMSEFWLDIGRPSEYEFAKSLKI